MMILVFSKSKTPFTVAFAVVYEKKRGFDNDFAQFSKNLVTTAIKLLIFVKKRGKIKGRAAFSEVRYKRKDDEDLYGTATVRHSVIYLNMGNQDLVER